MEPIAVRAYPDSRGMKYGATQLIFRAANGYGVSAVTVRSGGRWEHGWYVNGPGQFEAAMLYIPDPASPYDGDFVRDEDGHILDPKGWLYVEELGKLLERIEAEGVAGWR